MALVFSATDFIHAQGCTVLPSEAVGISELADAFGGEVSVAPLDDVSDSAWWVRDAESVPVAVIEGTRLDTTTAEPQLVLDAQHLGGNDFIAAVPVRARAWRCER